MDRNLRASRVIRALRRVNFEGSIFGQNVAIRFGLSESDVDTLERLAEYGSITAGHLSELMGLSTGAITRVLDRLEQAGYIRRSADPADRRRVIVSLVPDKTAGLEALTDRLAEASEAELARYTEDQLDAIADFLARMTEVTRTESTALRDSPEAPLDTGPAEYVAALAGASQGRIVFRSGAHEISIRGGSGPTELYRAKFEGPVPQVRVRNGLIGIQYRSGRAWDWRKRHADLAFNATIPWTVSISGGASRVSVDATRLDLRLLELAGGADRLRVTLGKPTGEAVIRVLGGSSQVRVDRPAGVPVRLSVRGGAGSVELDGQHIGGTGAVSLATPGADQATDRISIEVAGGTGRVMVGSTAG
jgi:DNA-binding MarR family transcriptional regulator